MNQDIQKDALIQALVNQRNQALNMAAEMEAALFAANMKIGELDKEVSKLAELLDAEKTKRQSAEV